MGGRGVESVLGNDIAHISPEQCEGTESALDIRDCNHVLSFHW